MRLKWALDSKSLYVLAEDRGSVLPYHLKRPNRLPTPLVFRGSTSSIQPLSNSTFLLATSTLTHPTEEFVLDISEPLPPKSNMTADSQVPRVRDVKQITSWSHAGLHGKHLSEGEPFWFEGANEERVMGWIVRPPGFKESDQAKWPLAMLIHGGPQVGAVPCPTNVNMPLINRSMRANRALGRIHGVPAGTLMSSLNKVGIALHCRSSMD